LEAVASSDEGENGLKRSEKPFLMDGTFLFSSCDGFLVFQKFAHFQPRRAVLDKKQIFQLF
jgi:hypothetical protein